MIEANLVIGKSIQSLVLRTARIRTLNPHRMYDTLRADFKD